MEIAEKHPQTMDADRASRLIVTLHPAYQGHGRQYRWSDGTHRRIEHFLTPVLIEIERRAAEARKEHTQRLTAWQAALHRAQHQARYTHYAAALLQQADDWHHAHHLRTYCDALRQRIHQAQQQGLPTHNAHQWLAWAEQYVTDLDPLLHATPEIPAFTPKPTDLEPFLDGWYADRPEKRLNRRPARPT